MLQLHKIIIGLIFVGMISTGLVLFISSGTTEYSISSFDNESMTSFNKLSNLSEDINSFRSQEENVTSDDGLLDILGSFFTNMYTSAKVFRGSVDVMDDMVDSSLDAVPSTSSSFTSVVKTGLGLILMVAIFVGIFLAFVTKSERT